jgi:succinate dehydrogenase/fumarate reductase cytochrome b subunit (b558 family)
VAETPTRRQFFLRRLHSFTGVVPLGVFLVEHLWTNLRALEGRDAFNRAVGQIQSIPLLIYIELFGIGLPLLYHAVYGLRIAARGSANVGRYPFVLNWLYLLQRISGVLALGFISLHLWQYRVQKLFHRLAWQDFYYQLGVDLNRPAIFALYVLGVSAVVFHFSHGLWLFGSSWGITLSTRSMRRSAWICSVFGATLWLLSMNILFHFAVRCGGFIPMFENLPGGVCEAW